uniref:PPM-type phosphatase domain-containing protein n=1 Tax=Timema genevievae TaxID=629358 RepID=A0A7R9PQE7_TIMGE|nr:unnamed protein product [Timema genevievae]
MGAYLSEPITDKISHDEVGKRVACGACSMQGWRVTQELTGRSDRLRVDSTGLTGLARQVDLPKNSAETIKSTAMYYSTRRNTNSFDPMPVVRSRQEAMWSQNFWNMLQWYNINITNFNRPFSSFFSPQHCNHTAAKQDTQESFYVLFQRFFSGLSNVDHAICPSRPRYMSQLTMLSVLVDHAICPSWSCYLSLLAMLSDAHNCLLEFDKGTSLFAVYDGHGGHEVAQYCAQNFPEYIKQRETFQKGDYIQALKESFLGFDETLATPEVVTVLKRIADSKDGEKTATDEDYLYEVYLHVCGRRVENHFGKTTLTTPNRDMNLYLPIIGGLD